ncbi:DUF2957 domain-containing protein [Paraburkholderia megapolitana]|uniref:DUF2957 domain-containing protein n=1 Tax=Paraburkholderia megapolitana TaxID=420953 RepID=A0A1I3SNH2_9BURK|nr:DUF2957 domain-containing protein [Paraburkholderia megapolitana]QDQ85640.1 DUF2957 domain-containing protein [Paraburkholderia megapolitana]SFJ59782.1 Protein of unknown function [Paraburkholderia megapolitana]
MSYAIFRGVALAVCAAPLMVACGGGNAGNPGPINSAQCSGASCGVQGPPTSGAGSGSGSGSSTTAGALCPATGDIVKSTYLGGAGSGEVVSLNIDAQAMTYTLKWLESPIPLHTGTVTPSRAGVQITGAVAHPPTGALPTAEQIRCAFILTPGSGTASVDGSTYSTAASFNQANPPMILVGLGVAGGGIPGATVQFNGLNIDVLGVPLYSNVGQVPNRHFDFYPFLGFASTTTDISKLPGTYNGLLYHLAPSASYQTIATNSIETFDANGGCTSSSAAPTGGSASSTGCLTTGAAWTLNGNGYFDSQQAPQLLPQFKKPIVGASGKSGTAHMVLGQINGATVPLIVRTGFINLGTAPLYTDAQIDDESGISLLAKATPIASGGFDGGYVGADSNFKYTATLVQGTTASFLNPSTSQTEDGFTLNYGLSSPGLIGVTVSSSKTGYAIASGGLYAIEIQGNSNDSVNSGITPTSAIPNATPNMPYFGVGAQISK